jgi:hypothetical protein
LGILHLVLDQVVLGLLEFDRLVILLHLVGELGLTLVELLYGHLRLEIGKLALLHNRVLLRLREFLEIVTLNVDLCVLIESLLFEPELPFTGCFLDVDNVLLVRGGVVTLDIDKLLLES